MATPAAAIPFRHLFGSRYGVLLGALLLLILLAPILDRRAFASGLNDALVCCVILTGLHAATGRKRSIAVGFLLSVPILVTHRLIALNPHRWLHGLHYALTIAMLAYATVTILYAILLDSRVTPETIKGAICVYLMLGLSWAYLDTLIDLLVPHSFHFVVGPEGRPTGHVPAREEFTSLMYFSFATLTTLGYGDIIPLSAPARTFAYLEAVVGQIYLTVLVARLVGMHISQPPRHA